MEKLCGRREWDRNHRIEENNDGRVHSVHVIFCPKAAGGFYLNQDFFVEGKKIDNKKNIQIGLLLWH